MIKAIIFDCFGVFYTDPVFAYMNKSTTPKSLATALHDLDSQAAIGALSKQGFIINAASLLNKSPADVEKQFFQPQDHNQELVDFVLHNREQFKTALLSNIGGDMMDGFFGNDDYTALFDTVVLSGDVGIAKPNPEIFKLTCDQLGISPQETIMVDDIPANITAAKAIGMQGIVYKDFRQFKLELTALLEKNDEHK